jgi:hypothetical protein
MKKYTFSAYGNKVTLEGPTAISVMEQANRQLLWSNPKYHNGIWSDGPDEFYWIEGNFFD